MARNRLYHHTDTKNGDGTHTRYRMWKWTLPRGSRETRSHTGTLPRDRYLREDDRRGTTDAPTTCISRDRYARSRGSSWSIWWDSLHRVISPSRDRDRKDDGPRCVQTSPYSTWRHLHDELESPWTRKVQRFISRKWRLRGKNRSILTVLSRIYGRWARPTLPGERLYHHGKSSIRWRKEYRFNPFTGKEREPKSVNDGVARILVK